MTAKLISLLYVSEAVSAAGGDDPVQAIAEASVARNAALEVTGALVFTGRYFAQVLEGSPEAVEHLMDSIRRDPRHANIQVVDKVGIAARNFPEWSLAYAGRAIFVERHIEPLFDSVEDDRRTLMCRRLIDLMREFISRPRRG